MDSLPNLLGYLLLDEEGAVIAVWIYKAEYSCMVANIFLTQQSNGDLENDERIGSVIVKMLRVAHKQELGITNEKDGFQRMTGILNFKFNNSQVV